MIPLQITANLISPLAVSCNWSPMLDGLLNYLQLEKDNLLSSNIVDKEQLIEKIPLDKLSINGTEIYKCSCPIYKKGNSQLIPLHKRWDIINNEVDFNKRKAQINRSEGTSKSYSIYINVYDVSIVTWYCVGELEKIKELLSNCHYIGTKKSLGYGEVSHWDVEMIEEDRSIFYQNKLMRHLPMAIVTEEMIENNGFNVFNTAYKMPYYLNENKTACLMPSWII